MKKKEILITVLILVLAAGLIFFNRLQKSENKKEVDQKIEEVQTKENNYGMPQEEAKGKWVAIIHRNKVVQWFDSGVNGEFTVEGDYGTMHVKVDSLQWCVHDVECPNQTCVGMGWDNGDLFVPITCIPNNVLICTYDVAINYLENYQ